MDIEAGNAGSLDTAGTGWFVGHGLWTLPGSALRFMARDRPAGDIQIKWMTHPTADPRGDGKPPSSGRTISVLVSETGRFRLEFAPDEKFLPSDRITHTLKRHGDFVIWGANIHHRWRVEEACTILTVRWAPLPAEEVGGPSPG